MQENSENKIYAQKAFDHIASLCLKFGPRTTCSQEEKDAAIDIKENLSKYCDETCLDEFSLYPNLYPSGFIKITAMFVLIGFFFMFLRFPFPIFATIFPILGFIQVYFTYMKMSEIFGFFFKKGKSCNSTGRIFPRDNKEEIAPTKKRVIICGHIDSAFQFPLTNHGDNVYLVAMPGFLFIIIQIIFGIVKMIILSVGDPVVHFDKYGLQIITLDYVFLIISVFGIPSLIYLIKGLVGKTPVEGANDNLSGVGIALSLGEYFSKPENRLKNIELWVGGFGSEECGERGAQAFVKKYGGQGLLDDSYSIIPESCGGGDRLAIITKEPIHFAIHDLELCESFFKGYSTYLEKEKVQNPVPCKVQKLPFSASDAGRFSLAGYKATMFIAFEGALAKPKNWHHPNDTPAGLDLRVLETVFATYKHFLKQLDEELS